MYFGYWVRRVASGVVSAFLDSSIANSGATILHRNMSGTMSILQSMRTATCFNLQTIRNATKKAAGSSRNGRDSPGQRLGVKKFGGEHVIPGNIIIRQRGRKFHPSLDGTVGVGRDDTLYALKEGWVKFTYGRANDRPRSYITISPDNPNIKSTKNVIVAPAELAVEVKAI